MQWIVLVLILMGQCSLCPCFPYQLVEQLKTWEEAVKYCTAHHIDLVTVRSAADMEALVASAGDGGDAWIGLRRASSGPKTWHWSMPGVEFTDGETGWRPHEPNDIKGLENCVAITDHQWLDLPCYQKRRFICYDKTDTTFHLETGPKTWREAQSVCREKHTDLVSGLTQLRDGAFQEEIKSHKHEQVWIGLFRLRWRWSDGSTFRLWDPEHFEVGGDEADEEDEGDEADDVDEADKEDEAYKACAAVSDGNLKFDKCHKEKYFFCSTDPNNVNSSVPGPPLRPDPLPGTDPLPGNGAGENSNGPGAEADQLILVDDPVTWERALTRCRKNRSELVSVTNAENQTAVQELAKRAKSSHVWMGLRYSCTLDLWFWVSNQAVRYQNWDRRSGEDDCDMSGAMEKEGEHKWFKKSANQKFSFICFKR